MQYLRDSRGVTLIELLVTLMIGTMIAGLVFLVPQLFQKQNQYNESFNTAKNQVLLITNTLIEKVEKADKVTFDSETNKILLSNFSTGTVEEFHFKQKPSPKDYLYDVSYNGDPSLGTVGFNIEQNTGEFFILTLWAPYQQSNSVEEKFVVTQGFHTSVIK